MSKRTFRWILLLYLLFATAEAVLPARTTVIPVEVIANWEESVAWTHSYVFASIALLAALVFRVSGYIGLWFFWNPARWLFATGILLRIVSLPFLFPWYTSTTLHRQLSQVNILLEGVIIVLIFWGPAVCWFSKHRSASSG